MTKTNIDITVSSLNSKIAENKAKNESIENELKKQKTFDFGYFIGKSHFEEDGAQNYLLFQPIKRYFKIMASTYISSWQSKGLSEKAIKLYATSDHFPTLLIDYYVSRVRLKFNGSCLKQSNKLRYSYGPWVNIYIVYEHGASGFNDIDPTLKIVYLVQLL